MKHRIPGTVALFAALAALVITLSSVWARSTTVWDQLDLIVDVRHEIVDSYVEEPDQDKLVRGALRGMVDSLDDPYTVYLTEEDLEPFNRDVRGEFSGIGAEVDMHNERLRIVSPLEDSPAWNAGVLAGDIVLEIEGEDTLGLSLQDAVDRLLGKPGTDVTIKVRHLDGKEQTITITRAVIKVKTVRGAAKNKDGGPLFMLDPKHKIGYIRLTQFTGKTGDELEDAIEQLQQDGAKGLILDLRFNPGGLLDQAIRVGDAFLDAGQEVVGVKGRSKQNAYTGDNEPKLKKDIPLVVLINEASASASEIVSGALKDHGRAHVVGTRSFGKGSVQEVKQLESGQGAIKITTAYWYTPDGRRIHRTEGAETWGIDPTDGAYVPMSVDEVREMIEVRRDVGIDGTVEQAIADGKVTPAWLKETYKDPQLAAALEAVLGRIGTGDWPTVGESNEDQLIRERQRQNLIAQRDRLQEALTEVQKELEELGDPDAVIGPIEGDVPATQPTE